MGLAPESFIRMNKVFCTVCNAEKGIKATTRRGNRVDHLLKCGHRFIELNLYDSVKIYDLLEIKKKSRENFSKDHKWDHEQVIGGRVGKDGKPVFVHQIIDRTKNYYKKFVKHGNKVIKDIEQKLTEHQ